MELPEHVLKNGPWSISKAGVIQKCSLQFDFKYGAQKQPELVKTFDSRIGTTVHKALEFALDNTPLKKSFMFAIDQNELTTDEVEKVNTYHDQVAAFVKRMDAFKAKYGVKPENVFLERQVGLSVDFKAIPFFDKTGFFRGVLDYGMLTANNDMVIIDHKTGKQKAMSEYADQCKAYCLLALAMFPDLKGVQTAINFVQTDKLEWNPRVTADTIRNEYQPWIVKYVIDSCPKLLKPPTPTTGWFCSWCGYKPICPQFSSPAGVENAAAEAR